MQDTSSRYQQLQASDVRPIAAKVFIAFDREFDTDATFFTINSSIIGGNDFIPGNGDVVQEWDRYLYTDYSSRLLAVEWERENDPIWSVSSAMADIVFDNHDDFFNPNGSSSIAAYIKPSRPIRILAGFENEMVPQFVGITEGMPVLNDKDKTATFHAVDFMFALYKRPLLESETYINYTASELMREAFILAGIDSAQLDFDDGNVIVSFATFYKGDNLGDIIKKLMQVETGRLFMDENGVISFRKRSNVQTSFVDYLTSYNDIKEIKTRNEDNLINVVEIDGGQVREVQPLQAYWELPYDFLLNATAIKVPASGSVDIWAEFNELVTSVDAPVAVATADTSYYTINTQPDGSGSVSTSVTLTSTSFFGDTYKMTFTNASSNDLYISALVLFATPAVVVDNIYVREVDETSIDDSEEKVLKINNEFFQASDVAQSRALIILEDWASTDGIYEMEIRSNFALQLDDLIRVNDFNRVNDYTIIRIVSKITAKGCIQILRLQSYTRREYFTINQSRIGGTDEIAP